MFITNQKNLNSVLKKKGWGIFGREKKEFTLNLVSGLNSIF